MVKHDAMLLNLDILAHLASQLELRRDILALMRTCKPVYTAGIPALLKEDVRFWKEDKLASFCDFILTDTGSRAKHIKGLEFTRDLGEVEDDLAEKLSKILEHATGLERLTLASCDDLLSSDDIATALAGLTSITELVVRDCDTVVVGMVKQMKSPVTKASIQLNGQMDEDESNPIPMLAPFQHSLRKLYLWEPQLLSGDDEVKSIVFPELAQLDVVFWNNVELEPMLRAFPNVKRFSVGLQGYDDGGLEEDKDEIREKNESAQEETQWEDMEYIQGDPISLYITALKTEVARLDIRMGWEADAETISGILEHAHPARLDFRMETDWDNEPEVSEQWPSLFEAASENITHLFLEVRQIEDPEPAIVSRLCDGGERTVLIRTRNLSATPSTAFQIWCMSLWMSRGRVKQPTPKMWSSGLRKRPLLFSTR